MNTKPAEKSPQTAAAQILARSLWKAQNKDNDGASWEADKATYNKIARQAVAKMQSRGLTIGEAAS